MSGGSFDYLYRNDSFTADELEQMAKALDGLAANCVEGAAEAAAQTRELIQRPSKPLLEVWRAVEWWCSADYTRETVEKTLKKFQEDQKWSHQKFVSDHPGLRYNCDACFGTQTGEFCNAHSWHRQR